MISFNYSRHRDWLKVNLSDHRQVTVILLWGEKPSADNGDTGRRRSGLDLMAKGNASPLPGGYPQSKSSRSSCFFLPELSRFKLVWFPIHIITQKTRFVEHGYQSYFEIAFISKSISKMYNQPSVNERKFQRRFYAEYKQNPDNIAQR